RYATNPVDKVAGIGFLAHFHTLPVYSEFQKIEEAWENCIQHMPHELKEDLLFRLPVPCDIRENRWFPTWAQIERMTLPEDEQELARGTQTPAQTAQGSPLQDSRVGNVDRLSHSYYGDYVQRGHLKWHAVAPDHELVTGIIKAPN